MPISNDGSIKYTMPEEIKKQITPEFCKQFLEDLRVIWPSEIKEYGYEFVSNVESTRGWNDALKATCQKLSLKKLYAYYNKLPWYDSDLFDWELTKLMVERGVLVRNETEGE